MLLQQYISSIRLTARNYSMFSELIQAHTNTANFGLLRSVRGKDT